MNTYIELQFMGLAILQNALYSLIIVFGIYIATKWIKNTIWKI